MANRMLLTGQRPLQFSNTKGETQNTKFPSPSTTSAGGSSHSSINNIPSEEMLYEQDWRSLWGKVSPSTLPPYKCPLCILRFFKGLKNNNIPDGQQPHDWESKISGIKGSLFYLLTRVRSQAPQWWQNRVLTLSGHIRSGAYHICQVVYGTNQNLIQYVEIFKKWLHKRFLLYLLLGRPLPRSPIKSTTQRLDINVLKVFIGTYGIINDTNKTSHTHHYTQLYQTLLSKYRSQSNCNPLSHLHSNSHTLTKVKRSSTNSDRNYSHFKTTRNLRHSDPPWSLHLGSTCQLPQPNLDSPPPDAYILNFHHCHKNWDPYFEDAEELTAQLDLHRVAQEGNGNLLLHFAYQQLAKSLTVFSAQSRRESSHDPSSETEDDLDEPVLFKTRHSPNRTLYKCSPLTPLKRPVTREATPSYQSNASDQSLSHEILLEASPKIVLSEGDFV